MIAIYRDYDPLAGPLRLALVFRSIETVPGANGGGFFLGGKNAREPCLQVHPFLAGLFFKESGDGIRRQSNRRSTIE